MADPSEDNTPAGEDAATLSVEQASSLSPAQLVAAICSDQQRRWKAGDRVKVEHYLEEFPRLKVESHAVDLICNEFVLRERSGQAPEAEDMLARFPQWAEALRRQPLFRGVGDGSHTSLTLEDPQEPGEVPHITSGVELGDYVVIRLLGVGGMGQVFKALHKRMDRIVAIKVLSHNAIRSPDSLDRFRREMKVAASMNHPNIVTAYDAGEFGNVHYLAMEYVEGETFAQLLRSQGPVAPDKAVDYTLQAARGLAYAHSRGVIHRDIKPANLLLSAGGVVKILDMGIARLTEAHSTLSEPSSIAALTRTGSVLGTVDYMAPEQAEDSAKADQRSDIYSLGCTLYTLISGRLIYEADTLVKRIIAHRQDSPPSLRLARPTISPALDRVFRRMVAKRPADRFASMEELIKELEGVHAGRSRGGRFWPVAAVAASAVVVLTISMNLGPRELAKKEENPPVENKPVKVNGTEKKIETKAPEKVPPVPLPATFTPERAREARTDWAESLKIPKTDKNSIGMNLQLIPPGEFQMGSPEEEIEELVRLHETAKLPDFWKQGFKSEGPQRRVVISRPFYLGSTEVTIREFRAFVDDTGHQTDAEQGGKGGFGRVGDRWVQGVEFNWRNVGVEDVDSWPVFNVSHRDAAAFCTWLSQKEKRKYQLPTEAQWEYACRAGTTTRWPTGKDSSLLQSVAWYNLNSGNTPHPVGQSANSLELSDMLGNVWEWCADWHSYDYYQTAPPKDPLGPATGTLRVMRGGSYYLDSNFVRPACRIWYGPQSYSGNIGFRVAREVPP